MESFADSVVTLLRKTYWRVTLPPTNIAPGGYLEISFLLKASPAGYLGLGEDYLDTNRLALG